MLTIRLTHRGRVYYYKAENRADGMVLIFALENTYPGSKAEYL